MTESIKSYGSASIKKLDKSRVEITGSIAAESWEKHRAKALKNMNESVTIDGFRKGNIPENILIAKIGEMALLEEMAELALSRAYIEILIDNKLDAIGKPEIHVTKLAKGNPLEFKATTAITPEVKLPDYKELALDAVKKNQAVEKVTDKDIEDAILRIRKSHASHEPQRSDLGNTTDKVRQEKADRGTDQGSTSAESLPELTDDFVKKLGDFNDVPDFRTKLSSMLAEEKKNVAKEKLRISIAEAIAAGTEVELPELMVESELNRTQAQFSADIEHMGVKMEDYLKHAKKSPEDIRKEWRPHAEKKAKLQLILNAIATKENIVPSKEEIEAEVNHILEHYKDADREHAAIYAETVLTNEKVFEWLEK
jgi:trigger factor